VLSELVMTTKPSAHNLEVARTLEARFHAQGRGNDFVVVGRIVCAESGTLVEPEPDLAPRLTGHSPASVITNLRYLVLMSRPCPYEYLHALDSRHWSFVTIDPNDEARRLDPPPARLSIVPQRSAAADL
jgi:hypothetical protein